MFFWIIGWVSLIILFYSICYINYCKLRLSEVITILNIPLGNFSEKILKYTHHQTHNFKNIIHIVEYWIKNKSGPKWPPCGIPEDETKASDNYNKLWTVQAFQIYSLAAVCGIYYNIPYINVNPNHYKFFLKKGYIPSLPICLKM